ncbi:MAG: TonB-dependent receptor plug domain-containing protein [Gammaproteobacteria bacterium]|nr:TonB-dependent receptor plug domain-containing protein [Gammaproteobacteria bacterium]MYG97007.1 TonB-dependent receptor plug domain-containing protein [Gammaproteobacteria bacterium]
MQIPLQTKRTSISVAVAAALAAPPVLAQPPESARGLEEIFVTATRVERAMQDVPVAVSALNPEDIDELGITNFSDYVLQLPSVTAGGSGPGQNTIYIRGVASTTPNLTVAGVAGLSPNVAFYLDEQPLAQPGRNLDVYAADLARIEVLSGPQGTLFGASSQAGNVRLITNKPETGEFYGNAKLGANAINDGDSGSNFEFVVNVPVTDNFAVRGVVYKDNKGGWIDNVPGRRDASQSARFRPEGVVRKNGVPVASYRAGFQAGVDLSNINFLAADNSSIARSDINGVSYLGGRVSALWDINEDWELLVAHTSQDTDADGVFFADPDIGDLEISRFVDEGIKDTFDNTSWTLTGRVADLEVIYTGAFTDRQSDQIVDYSDYLFVGQYLPYYICDYYATYTSFNTPPGVPRAGTTCNEPRMFVDSLNALEVTTHEIRFATDQTNRVRFQGGVFMSDLELIEVNDFTYPGSLNAISWNGHPGFAPNYPLTNPQAAPGNPAGSSFNAGPGYYTYPGPFPPDVIFRNDIRRTDEQIGIFAEVGFDLSDQFALTLGARNYEIEVDLEGSANSSFGNFGANREDGQRFGTNISQQFRPGNSVGAPDKAVADGTIFKATLDWRPQDDRLYYVTISEGFRPGLLNRPGGRSSADGSGFVVPWELETDEVLNFEVGMKADFDNSLRVNAALFKIDIENLQTTIFDTSIVNLFFSDNAADAEVFGLESDFTWLPEWSDGLTVAGAVSWLNSEITRKITPTNDVRVGDALAFAPSFQGNLRARYEWELPGNGWVAHVMPMINWSSESYSDIITINRDLIDGWTMLGVTAGVAGDGWAVTFYASNLTDERAEVSRSFVFDTNHVTYAQPRTFGIRTSFDF